MTYHNRILSTPNYINTHHSPFWSYVAHDTALRIGEFCNKDHGYESKRITCFLIKNNLRAYVTCNKCNFVFHKTAPIFEDMVGYFGF